MGLHDGLKVLGFSGSHIVTDAIWLLGITCTRKEGGNHQNGSIRINDIGKLNCVVSVNIVVVKP